MTDAAVLMSFGTALLGRVVALAALAGVAGGGLLLPILRLRPWMLGSAVALLALLSLWLTAVAQSLGMATSGPTLAAAVLTVAGQTQFGHLVLGSLACLLLAAGAWPGALTVFCVLIRRLPLPEAAAVARGFSPLGATCVLFLAITASVQGWIMIGGFGRFLSTPYGGLTMIKLLLFLLLLGLAAANRGWLTPRLTAGMGEAARTLS